MSVVWATGRYVKEWRAERRVGRRRPRLRSGNVRRRLRTRRPVVRRGFFGRATAADLAGGMSIFPLGILALSVFSDGLLDALLLTNRLILSVAGISALFGALEDFQQTGRRR
jgi:hypothetical protein